MSALKLTENWSAGASKLVSTTLVIDEFDQWSNSRDGGFATTCVGNWYGPDNAAE
jgi:hypothetical protein